MPIRNPEEAHRIFADAVNSGNVEAVVALYDREARLVDQPGKPAVGREAIREAFQNLLALQGKMHAVTTTVSRTGDFALLRARWTYETLGPAGELTAMSGDSVEVLRRQPDGSWLFTIDLPFGNDEGVLPTTARYKTIVRR